MATDPLLDQMFERYDRAAWVADAPLDGVLDALGAAITVEPRSRVRSPPSRRRRRWLTTPRGLLLVGAMLALLAGGAAATKLLTARTGHYNHGLQALEGGPGENLRTAAPDFCSVALKLSSDIAYPPGYDGWRTWVVIAENGLAHVTANGAEVSNGADFHAKR